MARSFLPRNCLWLMVACILTNALALAGPVMGDEKRPEIGINTWVKLDGARIGPRCDHALLFDPIANRFLLLGGGIAWPIYAKQPHPFDDLAFDRAAGKWENLFPSGMDWGPRYGDANPPPFKDEFFALTDKEG